MNLELTYSSQTYQPKMSHHILPESIMEVKVENGALDDHFPLLTGGCPLHVSDSECLSHDMNSLRHLVPTRKG